MLVYSAVFKQTKAETHMKPLGTDVFQNRRLRIVTHFWQYSKVIQDLRKGKQLFISFVKPHKEVSRDTISRWIKTVLSLAGVAVSLFSAYSARATSMSAASSRNVPTDCPMKTAGWSRQSPFSKF